MSSIPKAPEPPEVPLHFFLPSSLLEDDEFTEKRRQKELQFLLVSAIENGDVSKVKAIIEDGVNTNCTIILVMTPLTHALNSKQLTPNPAIVRLLVDGADTNVNLGDSNPWRWKPLHYIASYGSVELAEIVVEGSKRGECDIDVRDGGQATPLHHAARGGHMEMVNYLLARGADVNACDDCGRTALHRATEVDNLEVAQLLLQNGADVNAADNYGWTPIFQVVLFLQVGTLAFLLKQGASAALSDTFGQSLLHIAGYNRLSHVHKREHPNSVLLNTSFHYIERKRKIVSQEHMSLIYFMDGRINDEDVLTCVQLLINAGVDPALYPTDGLRTQCNSALAKTRAYLNLAGAKLAPDDPWVCCHDNENRKWTDWFHDQLTDQLSLRRLCRYSIRRCLSVRRDIDGAIRQLNIPQPLKMLLGLEREFQAFLDFTARCDL